MPSRIASIEAAGLLATLDFGLAVRPQDEGELRPATMGRLKIGDGIQHVP